MKINNNFGEIDLEEIAAKHDLNKVQAHVFYGLIRARFFSATEEYISEWAERFAHFRAWQSSDVVTQGCLREIAGPLASLF